MALGAVCSALPAQNALPDQPLSPAELINAGRYEEALHYYRRFATRWQNADPHLQPQVEEARQRIRELEAELN